MIYAVMQQEINKKVVQFQKASKLLFDSGLRLIDLDITRPWGFFLSVDESQAKVFIDLFYKGVELQGIDTSLPLRPKLLGLAPGKRLSWQYHHRRAEIWRCLEGSYDLATSETDTEDSVRTVRVGEAVDMPQGMRHRGIGLDDWALVAEIWQHTNPDNPSSEDDIVRIQDDFGR
jgi:mannose-6-phosphate isomerase